jgi:spore germination protein GerM
VTRERITRRGRVIDTKLGGKIIIVLVVVTILVVSVYLISRWREMAEEVPPEIERIPEETRSVTLYFASEEADRLLSETHEIAVEERIEEQVKAVLAELIRGPEDRGRVSPIPQGTEILQAVWVEETQTIYIDFNRVLVSAHPGGSTSEYYTISVIIRTIAANFPQVRRVQFLVDGYPVETLAGHYAVGEPIDVLRWR